MATLNTAVLGAGVQTSCSWLFPQDPALKLCLVQSLCMVSQAMCSSAQASSFHFSRKAELMAQMMVSSTKLLQTGSGGGTWGGQRPVGVECVQTEPCTSEASTTHFMRDRGSREEANASSEGLLYAASPRNSSEQNPQTA